MTDRIANINVKMDGNWVTVIPAVAQSAINDGLGINIADSYAKKTALTDGSVTKVGTSTVGSISQPVYLNAGVPIACTNVATKTELTDGSVTKVGTSTVGSVRSPIYLNNGVPTVASNVVTTDTNQEIGGNKIFITKDYGVRVMAKGLRRDTPADASTRYGIFDIQAADGRVASMDMWNYANQNAPLIIMNEAVRNGLQPSPRIALSVLANGGMTITRSSVNSEEGSDAIVTKGFVSATDGVTNNLVHTIGNEAIDGRKTYLRNISTKSTLDCSSLREYAEHAGLIFADKNWNGNDDDYSHIAASLNIAQNEPYCHMRQILRWNDRRYAQPKRSLTRLNLFVNETTGAETLRVEWSDGTSTTLATHTSEVVQ